MNKTLNIQDLGLRDYKNVWDLQESLFKKTIDIKIKNRLQVFKATEMTISHFQQKLLIFSIWFCINVTLIVTSIVYANQFKEM